MSPEGRAKTAAVNSWKEMVEEKNRLKAACMAFTPEGRAKRAAWGSWGEYMHEQLKLKVTRRGSEQEGAPIPDSPRALTPRLFTISFGCSFILAPRPPTPPAPLAPRLSPLPPPL